MEQNAVKCQSVEPTIETLYAAELFSKLPALSQDLIIDLIKSLLSGE